MNRILKPNIFPPHKGGVEEIFQKLVEDFSLPPTSPILILSSPAIIHLSYSTVLVDRNGELLGARIATDGQWRFPPRDNTPEK